jgi:hypothetical protein
MSTTNNFASELANGIGQGTKVQDLKPPTNSTKKQKTPSAVNHVEERAPSPPPPTSLKDQLLKRASAFDSGKQLAGAIKEADEASAEPEVVAFFVSVIDKADELGVRRFGFDRGPEQAEREWAALSPSEMEKELRHWSNEGDTIASQVLAELEQFKKNTLLWDLFWQVTRQFVRPCWSIRTYGNLSSFLRETAQKGLAQTLMDPKHIPQDGIPIKAKMHTLVYLPKKDISVSEAGWPFVKEAEKRAKGWAQEQQGRMEDLEEQATGLTPPRVKDGQEGRMSVRIGINRGVLLEVRNKNGNAELRVIRTVGVFVRPIPSNWISWNASANDWPSEEIFSAVRAWENRIAGAQKRTEEVHSVLDLATLPTAANEKALTTLFNGNGEQQSEVSAFCIDRFQWPYGDGPKWSFGLALGQNGGIGCLKVIDIRSTSPRQEQRDALHALKGQKLPQLSTEEQDGKLKVHIQKDIPKMGQADYEALLMVKTAIQMRLVLESKSHQEETVATAPALVPTK